MWYIVIFFLTLILDQVTKIIVDANDCFIPVIDGIFNINNHYNKGASFSFLAGQDWAQTFFIILTICVLVCVFVFLIFTKLDSKWLNTTVALLVSGTVGNFIDRIAFGHVRDFLDVTFFANFNVADCCLTIGAIMLIIFVLFMDVDSIFGEKKKEEATEQTDNLEEIKE